MTSHADTQKHAPTRVNPLFIDTTLAITLFGIALALRLPNFLTVPGLKDEFKIINHALNIVEYGRLPLVGTTGYVGPFWFYFNAAIINLFGYHLEQPRATVMVIGALTVVATYFLGKELARGDRRVGVIAALLLAFNAQHIVWNSHVAYSNHTTPFFVTLAFYFYVRATRRGQPWWLIAAAVAYGIAAQTHATALAIAPIFFVDLFLVRRNRTLLRTPYPYAAAALALLIFSPVLVHNWITQGSAIRDASVRDYAFQPTISPIEVGNRAYEYTFQVMNLVMGALKTPAAVELANALPFTIVFVGITVGCLIWFSRHEPFPLIAIPVGASALFLVNDAYTDFQGRYIAYQLPLLFTTYGATVVTLWDRVGEMRLELPRERLVEYGVRGGLIVLLIGLLGSSMKSVQERYDVAARQVSGEQAWIDMVRYAQERRDLPVWITSDLTQKKTGKVLLYYFRLEQHPVHVVEVQEQVQIEALNQQIAEMQELILIASVAVVAELEIELEQQFGHICRCSPSSQQAIPASLYTWQSAEPLR